MKNRVTQDQVEKALASLDAELETETVSKASDNDLDQPEGADLGNPAKEKMSDSAKAKKAMAKKAEDEGSEEDEEEDEMEEKEKAHKAKKSFAKNLPEEIETKIDVSEFLKSLVKHTGDSIDSLSEYVIKSDKRNNARYEDLEGAVEEVQKSQAKIGLVLKAICEKIGVIEAAPARAPKTETVAKSEGAKPTERTFSPAQADTAQAEEKMFKSLSENPQIAKSQLAGALCELVKSGSATDMDVIGFESSGYIRPELVGKLKEKLN